MNADSILLSRQGQRLLQVGVTLLLLLSLEGFAIPYLAAPHLGVSAHKLAALQSVLLLALGLAWPKLNLGAATSRIAFWLFIYAAFAILAAFDGCYLGSRQRNNAAGRRDRTRERISGNLDQGRGILLGTHGSHLLCADFWGASHCRTHKP